MFLTPTTSTAAQPAANPNPFGQSSSSSGLASLNPGLFASPTPAAAAPNPYGAQNQGVHMANGSAGGFNPFAGAAPAPVSAPAVPVANPLAQQQATPQQIVAVLQSMGVINPQVQMSIVQQMQFMNAAQQQQFIATLRMQILQQQQQQQQTQPVNMFGGGGVAAPPTHQPDRTLETKFGQMRSI